MLEGLLESYIHERYGTDIPEGFENLGLGYIDYLQSKGAQLIGNETGFIAYSLEGDACIVWDIYTASNHRRNGSGWVLFRQLVQTAEQAGKRVIIGFSDKIGQNRHLGLKAMEAGGFKPAFETLDEQVFIRGV